MDLKNQYEAMKKDRQAAFYGRTYRYHTPRDGVRTIGVCLGLGSDIYLVAWVSETGARKRVKTARLPVISDPAKLQAYLDAWAAKRKLEKVVNT